MNITAYPRHPGALVHLVAFVAAVAGVYWALSGMRGSTHREPVKPATYLSSTRQDSTRVPEFQIWSTGEIGRLMATHGFAVEALSLSGDEEEVVARVIGSYNHLCILTGRLTDTPGLSVNSLALRKSRHESQIEATLILGTQRAAVP